MDQPPGAGRLSEVHFVRHGAGGSAHRDLALSYTGPSPTGDHPKWWWSFRFSPKAINQVPSKKDTPTAREVEGGLGKNPPPSFDFLSEYLGCAFVGQEVDHLLEV